MADIPLYTYQGVDIKPTPSPVESLEGPINAAISGINAGNAQPSFAGALVGGVSDAIDNYRKQQEFQQAQEINQINIDAAKRKAEREAALGNLPQQAEEAKLKADIAKNQEAAALDQKKQDIMRTLEYGTDDERLKEITRVDNADVFADDNFNRAVVERIALNPNIPAGVKDALAARYQGSRAKTVQQQADEDITKRYLESKPEVYGSGLMGAIQSKHKDWDINRMMSDTLLIDPAEIQPLPAGGVEAPTDRKSRERFKRDPDAKPSGKLALVDLEGNILNPDVDPNTAKAYRDYKWTRQFKEQGATPTQYEKALEDSRKLQNQPPPSDTPVTPPPPITTGNAAPVATGRKEIDELVKQNPSLQGRRQETIRLRRQQFEAAKPQTVTPSEKATLAETIATPSKPVVTGITGRVANAPYAQGPSATKILQTILGNDKLQFSLDTPMPPAVKEKVDTQLPGETSFVKGVASYNDLTFEEAGAYADIVYAGRQGVIDAQAAATGKLDELSALKSGDIDAVKREAKRLGSDLTPEQLERMDRYKGVAGDVDLDARARAGVQQAQFVPDAPASTGVGPNTTELEGISGLKGNVTSSPAATATPSDQQRRDALGNPTTDGFQNLMDLQQSNRQQNQALIQMYQDKAAQATSAGERRRIQKDYQRDRKRLDVLQDNPGNVEGFRKEPDRLLNDQFKGQTITGPGPQSSLNPLEAGVMTVESRGNPNAVSPTGVRGLMQVTKGTAALYGLNRDIPAENLLAGKLYLYDMMMKFNGNAHLALAAYNAGPGYIMEAVKATQSTDWPVIREHLRGTLSPQKFKETSKYPDKVLAAAAHYLQGREGSDGQLIEYYQNSGMLQKASIGLDPQEVQDPGVLDAQMEELNKRLTEIVESDLPVAEKLKAAQPIMNMMEDNEKRYDQLIKSLDNYGIGPDGEPKRLRKGQARLQRVGFPFSPLNETSEELLKESDKRYKAILGRKLSREEETKEKAKHDAWFQSRLKEIYDTKDQERAIQRQWDKMKDGLKESWEGLKDAGEGALEAGKEVLKSI